MYTVRYCYKSWRYYIYTTIVCSFNKCFYTVFCIIIIRI
uniref:Uncharacterized protein n=1 Tax=Podoviridae sp. ct2m58 TaxID=2827721 RepID=A0A8S5TMI2_9CAUD|nr:MAG TPA: hypothetical protein [Podoviridae sp. ct2m58]